MKLANKLSRRVCLLDLDGGSSAAASLPNTGLFSLSTSNLNQLYLSNRHNHHYTSIAIITTTPTWTSHR